MLIKNISRTFLQVQQLMHLSSFMFSSQTSEFVLHPDIKHTAQINIRAARRSFLSESVLNHNKTVFWGQPRKLTDRIISLKNEGKCTGVIRRHASNINQGQEKDFDVVLPAKIIRGMRKNKNNGLMTVYVRVQDKQYRCILSQISMHHEGWIQQVVLAEYVPNEANRLTIPVQITHITENPYFQQGSQFEFKQQSIDIVCYNQQYPLKFYVDSSFVCPERPYRIGDLANNFPPGVTLASHVYPNQRVFEILPVEKMQLHLKQKLMKSYLASTRKEKVIGGGAAQGGSATGATGATGQQAAKK